MQEDGLRLTVQGTTDHCRPIASDDPKALPVPDVVIMGVKSHQIPAIAAKLKPLLAPETMVVSVVNGIPWWYGHGLEPSWQTPWLESVDPNGLAWKALGPERAIGCVTNIAASVCEPGHVAVGFESWYRLGEPTATTSPRLEALVASMARAGIDTQARPDIRSDVWHKLWGNAAYNPVSVLTEAPINRIATDPATRPVIIRLMEEIRAVAEACGIQSLSKLEERLAVAERLGPHKTSMLQDWQKGAAMEIGPIVGAVCELAQQYDCQVPVLSSIYGLLQQKEAIRQEWRQDEREAVAAHA
jgi:2-dehydropantoate 2-reductase